MKQLARLELNFVAGPRRALWPGMIVLAAALGLGGALFTSYRESRLELARLETTAGLAGAERRAAPALPKEGLEEELKAAEAVVRSLSLPWAALIESLERSQTREVSLLQLQPDAQSRTLRLTLEARSRAGMFDYVRRLDATRVFAGVHLVSHQVQHERIQFSVLATLQEPQ